jgi:GMP synthase (glutamine-hydrolysing)
VSVFYVCFVFAHTHIHPTTHAHMSIFLLYIHSLLLYITAATENAEFVAIENLEKKMWGLQFHPEVTHSPLGKIVLENFCVKIAGAKQDWVMTDYAQEFIESVRLKVGDSHVIGAVSGGVDSTVAAVLMTRAIGDRFHAVLVDNGCLRKNEAVQVVKRMRDDCGVNLRCVDASDRFMDLLKGVTDPEQKRKIIGTTFIHVFQEEAEKLEASLNGKCEFLLQGTLYPDVIESISYKGPSACIKTHHNVGGLPANMKLKLIEPLRELFKDEVRELGMALGIDEDSVWRHPFPGPGLAIRVLGEVTRERVKIAQEADAIVIEELIKSGHYRKIGQAFVVLLPCKTVGVMGDGRTYENVASVRCVETTDYMTADFYHLPYDVMGTMSSRVINEVRGINRLCYDISSKPPATIEWE